MKDRLPDSEIIADALSRHFDCKYGEVRTGMNEMFELTRVVLLWPDERSARIGNTPKYEVESYPA